MYFLMVLFIVIPAVFGDCYDDPEGKNYSNCWKCYQTMANALIDTDDNKYNLSRVFFPRDDSPPIQVEVIYNGILSEDVTGCLTNDTNFLTMYWLASEFYAFQPLELFLYRSLYFSPPSWRQQTINILLPDTCFTESDNNTREMFLFLTQRLKAYATTQTVEIEVDDSYIAASVCDKGTFHIRRLEANFNPIIIYFVYAVPYGFCFLGVIGMALFVAWRGYREIDNDKENKNSVWFKMEKFAVKISLDEKRQSNFAAAVVLSVLFNFYVFIMDVQSYIVEMSDSIPEYYDSDTCLLIELCAFTVLSFWLNLIGVYFLLYFYFYESRVEGFCTGKYHFDISSKKYVGYLAVILCIGSSILNLSFHFQNILIAWSIVPYYAGRIAIHYGVIFFVFFLSLKYTYKSLHKLSNFNAKNEEHNYSKKKVFVFCSIIIVSGLEVAIFAVLAMFIVYIPISNSIEDSAIGITTIYHGSVLILGALIAYNVGGHYLNGAFSMNDVLNNAMLNMTLNPYNIADTQWKYYAEEKKMSELVLSFLKSKSTKQIVFYLESDKIEQSMLEVVRESLQRFKDELNLSDKFLKNLVNAVKEASQGILMNNTFQSTEKYILTVHTYTAALIVSLANIKATSTNQGRGEASINGERTPLLAQQQRDLDQRVKDDLVQALKDEQHLKERVSNIIVR